MELYLKTPHYESIRRAINKTFETLQAKDSREHRIHYDYFKHYHRDIFNLNDSMAKVRAPLGRLAGYTWQDPQHAADFEKIKFAYNVQMTVMQDINAKVAEILKVYPSEALRFGARSKPTDVRMMLSQLRNQRRPFAQLFKRR